MQSSIIFIETTGFYLTYKRNVLEKESRQLQVEEPDESMLQVEERGWVC